MNEPSLSGVPSTSAPEPPERVISQQLGAIDVPASAMIRFPTGILGFAGDQTFCLVQVKEGSRFQLLQSCSRPDLAFVVIDPLRVLPDYDLEAVRRQAWELVAADEPLGVACIVTVREAPQPPTVNLLAPLAIGLRIRQGRQILLPDSGYAVRHEL
jgi:flagellar assembly factor FliW